MLQDLEVLEYIEEGSPIEKAFSLLRARVDIGGYRFPATSDYVEMVFALSSMGVNRSHAIVAAQRDWFRRGQTGCAFARLAAYEPTPNWPYVMVNGAEIDGPTATRVGSTLSKLQAQEEREVVSVLFRDCESISHFRDLVLQLVGHGELWVENAIETESHTLYEIRRKLAPNLNAWVMGFGPSAEIAPTRRSPFFELAIRVKPKPSHIYERLTQDRGVAHLADYPLEMPKTHWDHRWDSTLNRTRSILGHDTDESTAARTTLAVPH